MSGLVEMGSRERVGVRGEVTVLYALGFQAHCSRSLTTDKTVLTRITDGLARLCAFARACAHVHTGTHARAHAHTHTPKHTTTHGTHTNNAQF